VLLIHPVLQLLATLAALYALWLGWSRFRSLHLGAAVRFQRPRHILAGKAALILLLLGLASGLVTVRLAMGGWLVSETHGPVGLACLPLILLGLASGLYLQRRPAPRRLLPLAHGLNNLVLLGLALWQAFTGLGWLRGVTGW